MLCKDLNVVALNITEDYYNYQGLFRLCTGEKCQDVYLVDLDQENKLMKIKELFGLEEDIKTIQKIIKEKVMEAARIESRIVEGKI